MVPRSLKAKSGVDKLQTTIHEEIIQFKIFTFLSVALFSSWRLVPFVCFLGCFPIYQDVLVGLCPFAHKQHQIGF